MPREFCPMVSWYDPAELMRSARDVFISTVLGRHSDRRLLEALAGIDKAQPVRLHDGAVTLERRAFLVRLSQRHRRRLQSGLRDGVAASRATSTCKRPTGGSSN